MDLKAARLITVGHLQPGPDWQLAQHHHAFHELIVVCRGLTHVQIAGETLQGRAGHVLFYEAGIAHEERTDRRDRMETYYIAFEWNAVPPGCPLSLEDVRGRMRQLIQWLFQEGTNLGPRATEARQCFFHSLLSEWLRLANHQEHALIDKIRSYVRKHIDRPLTLDDLADHAGISKFHFTRLYKQLTSRTPMEDVRALRLEHAQQLILTTDLPLKAVAPKAGLGDQYRLSRLFRRYLNATPSEIRQSIKR